LAGYVELTIEQGATFSTYITVADGAGEASNISGYSTSAQLRKSHYSSTANNFTVTIVNAAAGNLSMAMSASNTANLTPGRYVYDLIITSPSDVTTRVIEGIVNVLPSVTR